MDSKRNGNGDNNGNKNNSDKNKEFKIALAAMTSSEDFAKLEKKLNRVLGNA